MHAMVHQSDAVYDFKLTAVLPAGGSIGGRRGTSRKMPRDIILGVSHTCGASDTVRSYKFEKGIYRWTRSNEGEQQARPDSL